MAHLLQECKRPLQNIQTVMTVAASRSTTEPVGTSCRRKQMVHQPGSLLCLQLHNAEARQRTPVAPKTHRFPELEARIYMAPATARPSLRSQRNTSNARDLSRPGGIDLLMAQQLIQIKSPLQVTQQVPAPPSLTHYFASLSRNSAEP